MDCRLKTRDGHYQQALGAMRSSLYLVMSSSRGVARSLDWNHPCRARQFFVSSDPEPLGSMLGFVPHPFLLCADANWRPTRLLPAPCALLHVLRANTAALLRARKNLDPSCSIITSLAPSCNFCTRYSRVLPCFMVLALRPLLRCAWELHIGGGMLKLAVIRSFFL